ncbi:MAG: hypothetical protein AAF513_04055 [Pseudomonadota bacterium]
MPHRDLVGSDLFHHLRGVEQREIDHVTLVAMTPQGPVIANVLLDGILH